MVKKENSSIKNKSNLFWIVIPIIILIVLIGAYFAFNTSQAKEKVSTYYPDGEGWNRKLLSNDEFQSVIPLEFNEGYFLVSPNSDGLLDNTNPLPDGEAYVEYRNNFQINVGSTQNPIIFDLIKQRRAFYAPEQLNSPPLFKMWVEKVPPEEFSSYKTYLLKDLQNVSGDIESTKYSYQDHEYHVALLKDLSFEQLRTKNTIGVVYIFFPEKDTSIFIMLFNTKYSPDAYLISKQEIKSVVEQLIDSEINSN